MRASSHKYWAIVLMLAELQESHTPSEIHSSCRDSNEKSARAGTMLNQQLVGCYGEWLARMG